MQTPVPIALERAPVRLEPLQPGHAEALESAAQEDDLAQINITQLPRLGEGLSYIETALQGQALGTMLPFVVRDLRDNRIIGSTRYHDIVLAAERVEIGYTWYAKRTHRSAVNTSCKLLLLSHAFNTLGAKVVGWRTDILNHRSQQAIERLGARKDGVIRHHAVRRDGTVRDTVMYSMTLAEWPAAQAALTQRLALGNHP